MKSEQCSVWDALLQEMRFHGDAQMSNPHHFTSYEPSFTATLLYWQGQVARCAGLNERRKWPKTSLCDGIESGICSRVKGTDGSTST